MIIEKVQSECLTDSTMPRFVM